MATVAFGVKVTEPGNVVDEKWFSDPYIYVKQNKSIGSVWDCILKF